MKPYPLASLNHFTVPCSAMRTSLHTVESWEVYRCWRIEGGITAASDPARRGRPPGGYNLLMDSPSRVTEMADVIRLSLAPVFLFSGISALLSVLANRLGRIIDRGRVLEKQLKEATAVEIAKLHDELAVLSKRASMIYVAVTLGVTSALLVCIVIATIFASVLLKINITIVVAIFFIAAMLVLIGALVAFLRDVVLATASLRIGPH